MNRAATSFAPRPSLPASPPIAATDSTEHDVRTSTPAASHSASSIATICLLLSSQNSWPSSFSW